MSRPEHDRAWMPPTPSAKPEAAAETLDGYADLVEIGRGGDSVVYRARQVSLDRQVAIKVLLVDDEETVARFRREIAITVDLGRQHPNIMTVLATGTTASGRPAIVMDLYEAGSLDHRLREVGPIPAAEVVAIGCVLADALQFAHDHGVLHRDVKPQNVMVLPTSWVLADFGIARLADSEHTASAERFTVRHASPQILDGHPPTAADDIWSLGSTLFTLLDGRTPFAASDPADDTVLAYLRRARSEPHRRIEVTADNEGLVRVIDRALAKDPAERWPSAAAMLEALEQQRVAVNAWAPEATGVRAGSDTAPRPAATQPSGSDDSPQLDPVPVALSVLAHDRATPAVDDEPTGLVSGGQRPVQDRGTDGGGDADGASGPGEEESRGRVRTALVLGVVALCVGVTMGVLGGWLRGGDEPVNGPAGSSGQPSGEIPTLSTPPTIAGQMQPMVPDDSIRPVIRSVTGAGTSATIEWVDRSKGKATFVIAQVAPEERFIAQVDPGVTTFTVEGADPNAERICYVVSAVVNGHVGTSKHQCWFPNA
ncbi:serine/threonine-protein kinase [Nocardioides sp. AE5]|uniref:serine/threonine-protein kinase n=1 Tax=Nocardioides sp. AE5 TaxID=2962573 RepID=UPI0028815B6E|nr:serine/threonine-protein kinase [Nocardioides sp. AE5]MDT0202774.1 serine/threonine-protein kinase [Nocardioides sp. AE5]